MLQARLNALVLPGTGDMPLALDLGGPAAKERATQGSKPCSRDVTTTEEPIAKRIKGEASDDNPITPSLGERVLEIAEAGLPDQYIDIGNIKYTRQELAGMPVKELNQLLKNENDEIKKFVKSIRRKEKNKHCAGKSRSKKIVDRQTISDQIKTLKLEKERLELENKRLLVEKKTMTERLEAFDPLTVPQSDSTSTPTHTDRSTMK